MLLMVGIGALFLLLHVVTTQRFAPLMPERMVTHWGPTAGGFGPSGWMSKRWGLRIGIITSLLLSVVNLAVGSPSSIYVSMVIAQIVVYLVVIWMYVQNAKTRKDSPGE